MLLHSLHPCLTFLLRSAGVSQGGGFARLSYSPPTGRFALRRAWSSFVASVVYSTSSLVPVHGMIFIRRFCSRDCFCYSHWKCKCCSLCSRFRTTASLHRHSCYVALDMWQFMCVVCEISIVAGFVGYFAPRLKTREHASV